MFGVALDVGVFLLLGLLGRHGLRFSGGGDLAWASCPPWWVVLLLVGIRDPYIMNQGHEVQTTRGSPKSGEPDR